MLKSVKVLHLEPTDVCNLECPLCARETDSQFDKAHHHHLTVDQIYSALGRDVIANLDKMFMCGNYGDPAAGQHTIKIYQYFRNINPAITLGMNTNGSLRTPNYWKELASILNQSRDYVVFSIDGLEDTNHIYRKGAVWSKIMDNCKDFIDAGGSAHWDMLVYKYNEHQVDECEQLAKRMGFKWFRAKVSKRPLADNLQYPVNWVIPKERTGPISCFALNEKSIYMDAQARISPCCWLGARQYDFNFKDVATSANPVCKSTCSTSDQSAFTSQWQREVELC